MISVLIPQPLSIFCHSLARYNISSHGLVNYIKQGFFFALLSEVIVIHNNV